MTETLTERWLPIIGWPHYEVSDLGRIRTYKTRGWAKARERWMSSDSPKTMKSCIHQGYNVVGLSNGPNRKKIFKVSVLVLTAFGGPCPEGHICCHGPMGRLNDWHTNLSWGSYKKNSLDRKRDGTHLEGDRHPLSKITREQALEIYNRAQSGENQREIAKEFGLRHSQISMINRKQSWKCLHQ